MITSTSIWSEHAFSTVMSALSRNRLTFNFNEEALNVKEQSGYQLVGPSILPNNNTSYNLKKVVYLCLKWLCWHALFELFKRIASQKQKKVQNLVQRVFKKQNWARDNTAATTWPCFQATQLLVIALLLYSLRLLHLVTETLMLFRIFSCLWGSITLSCCLVVVVAKLKNCCVPSSNKK